jgi:hypothetical protein
VKALVKVLALALMPLVGLAVAQGAEPDGKLTLPEFAALGAHATDSVNITLDPALLSVAARFLDSDDPQDAAVREVIAGVKGIYVKSYSFDKDFVYSPASIDAVRQQLLTPGWQRIVQVHSSKERSSVDIFICQAQSKVRGLALIATEPRQFTIVNIVGAVDLAKLHKLEGRFGIPKFAPAE